MATIEVPDDLEEPVVEALEEMLFTVEVNEDGDYEVTGHEG